jgi:hypothetical protein
VEKRAARNGEEERLNDFELTSMPSVPKPEQVEARASVKLRRLQEQVREIIREDQTDPQMTDGICGGLHFIENQLDKLAGTQELWEWYQGYPMKLFPDI